MSVIGPRPQLVRDMVFMTDEQRMRHTAKPGLSGLVDSDDVIACDMIEYLLCLLNTYKADMAVCQCDYVDENSKLIKNMSDVKKTCVSGTEECLKTLLVGSGLNTVAWGKMYKTDYFKNVRYPIGKYHEDIYTTYKLVEKCDKIVIGSEHKYLYRKRISRFKHLAVREQQGAELIKKLTGHDAKVVLDPTLLTFAIVNVVGSSIAREADKVFYTLAGPEISVATTKAYSAQLAAMYCIAVEFAFVRGKITEEQYAYYISELLTIAPKINKILEDKERLQWFAAKYAGAHDVFFVGRGIDYAVSLEGSLKLKEISYIHSEAYAAGELKHGTISLIEPGTLVIGVLTQSKLYEKTMSNMVECRSRGAYLLGLTTYGKYEIEETVDFAVYVPRIDEYFAGSLAVVPLQLLGYYVSVAKGLDVDKPRNLAKSVTVE